MIKTQVKGVKGSKWATECEMPGNHILTGSNLTYTLYDPKLMAL